MSLVLNRLEIDTANISCYICEAEEIQNINQEYRQQDKPTNILSFPFEELIWLGLKITGFVACQPER